MCPFAQGLTDFHNNVWVGRRTAVDTYVAVGKHAVAGQGAVAGASRLASMPWRDDAMRYGSAGVAGTCAAVRQ